MQVKVLPDHVVNQIAAGEVIERPAAVAKELIENSLDAQATEVQVEVQAGGKRLLRVIDNGDGMSPEDARLAIQRHATSKISGIEDLDTIRSFGFRGEALPSIAAVSNVEVFTRPPEALEGTRLMVEAGTLRVFEAAGCAPGTRITVSHLFHNVPARLKFLKSDTSESRALVKQATWAALVHPEVQFRLTHNDRKVIDVRSCASMMERIRLLYGKEMAENLLEFENEVPGFQLHAFLSKPDYTKRNRDYQLFFMNRRPIRSRLLTAALNEVMRAYIPRDRHAAAFIFLTILPDDVDVNVHPAKTEVRFRNERSIYSQVVRSLHNGIYQQKYIPQVSTGAQEEHQTASATASVRGPFPTAERGHQWVPDPSVGNRLSGELPPIPQFSPSIASSSIVSVERNDPDASAVNLFDMQHVQVKASLFNTFILAECEGDVLFVDQHVASERVLYERYVNQVKASGIPMQNLLLPMTLDLTAEQMDVFMENKEVFAKLGLDLEEFGGSTLVLRALPSELSLGEAEATVFDLLDQLSESGASAPEVSDIQDRALITLACHSAIRAGDSLTQGQMVHLLRELSQAELPFSCPHARPILVRMSRLELESRFKRR